MSQVTSLLAAIGQGKPDALGELYALLYPELRRLAHSRVRRSGDMTLLETTSLVHESYLRFEKSGAVAIVERAQFMAYAARVMRSVVVDMVRARHSERRGGDAVHVELDEANVEATPDRPAKTKSCACTIRSKSWQPSTRASCRWSRCAISPA